MKGRKEATSPSGNTGISIHAKSLGWSYSGARKEAMTIARKRVGVRKGRGREGKRDRTFACRAIV